MRAVVDSSALISLAWAGQLSVLGTSPVELMIPAPVRHETIDEGIARGYPDAAAIELAVKNLPVPGAGRRHTGSVDDTVLEAAREHGALITNDLALGRRASNLGVRWLRTADLVVLCVRAGSLDNDLGVSALRALYGAGRITEDLLHAYLGELS